MLWNDDSITVYLFTKTEDLRVGTEDLDRVIRRHRKRGVRRGEVFVFANRKLDRVKVLFRDSTGLWASQKHLAGRTYPDPSKYQRKPGQVGFVTIAPDDLARFLRYGPH